ncbi:peroxisomal 2,4-dienoyl-CoA reductase [Tanacetum coccineum]
MESPFKASILEGKVALLTGGGSGIGFEISTQFGLHGASIAIMGRRKSVVDSAVDSAVDSLRSQGIPAVGFAGDVRNQEDAKRVVESTFRHFGKLDILVNAAAGNFLVSPEDLSPNGFRTGIHFLTTIHFIIITCYSVGTFTMCHTALNYLKKGGPGRTTDDDTGGLILNISATLHYTASWYQIHVSAAKAAVDSITRTLALEWSTDYDIRVNGIAPGPINDTPGIRKLGPEEIESKRTKDATPLFKLGEKSDIAFAALYLASNAGNYVNGTTLIVDGGLWLSRPRHMAKDEVKMLSRVVEKRTRAAPSSKL